MFEILYERPLPVKYHLLYRDIAFDGLHYYLTLAGDNKIAKMSSDWQPDSMVSTERRYTCLCYDAREDCFWAASDNAYSVIFRLNRSFQENGRFSLKPFKGYVTALSYCSEDNNISIAVGGCLLNFDKTLQKRIHKIRQCGPLIMGVGFTCPYYLCCELKNSQHTLSVMAQDGSLVKEFTLPPQYVVSSVLIEKEEREHYHLQLLANKQGEAYLLEARLAKCDLASSHNPPTGPAITPPCGANQPEIPPAAACPPPLPGCPFSPECPPAAVGPPPHQHIPYPIYIPFPQPSPGSPYPCWPPVMPPPPPCNQQEPCPQEVFHAIAHTNCLIARILQAESEKLEQANLGLDQVEQLLALNESANRMLTRVTHLEQTLYSLLDAMLRDSRTAHPKTKQAAENKTENGAPRQ